MHRSPVKGRWNKQDARLLVGIDSSQGSLKFILIIEDKQHASDKSKYKDFGVKHCFILAIEHVNKIWSRLELGTVNTMITGTSIVQTSLYFIIFF